MTKEIIFGDKSTFGIRYASGYTYKGNPKWLYSFLHLTLGGQIIGDKDESCSTETWIYNIKRIQKRLVEHFADLKNTEFKDRRDDEVFELVWKSNQSEEEFSPEYQYLPVLDNDVWSSCHLSIDETIDAWLITMTEDNSKLKFIWKGWRNPCPEEEIGKLYSTNVDKDFVVKTINECVSYVENDYKNYRVVDSWDETTKDK